MTPKEDLQRSGLNDATISAMRVKRLSALDLEERGIQNAKGGYLIPYFDFQGNVIPDYYRIKLLPSLTIKGREVKYMQPKASQNHLYIPPVVNPRDWFNPNKPLVFVEGEKKAAAGCQHGILSLGLGGVDAWRSRTVKINPESVVRTDSGATLRIEGNELEEIIEQVAPELLALPLEGRLIIICHDSDCVEKPNVQRAAFEFSVWLQGEGAIVKQKLLPHDPTMKMGLDDFLCVESADAFWALEDSYPRHPRIRAYLRKAMDNKRQKRSDQVKCAVAILNDLDARGQRFIDPSNGSFYYFDRNTNVLHTFRWESAEIRQIRLSSFGAFLQEEFGVGATDTQLMSRVADLYASKDGIKEITPRKVSWAADNALYYQISDSFVAKVTSRGISIEDNGVDDVLFLSGQVEPVSLDPNSLLLSSKEAPRWIEALKQVNFQPLAGMTHDQTVIFIAALYYLSPLFRRWRGMMLPVELTISEPNSGKTFLYNLRKAILTGQPSLANPPTSVKDWYSQLASSQGIWICDNMGELARDLRETMSDELARLTTDPDPKVEMRKLYTTLESGKWPIDATFAITAIRNPFWKPDILQRSIVLNMKAIPVGKRDSMWYRRQIEGKGRAEWVADHLRMASKFLRVAEQRWDDHRLSSHRLVNFEQALLCMGEAMGYKEEMEEIVKVLFQTIQSQIMANDPILEALKCFVEEYQGQEGKLIRAVDIVAWAQQDVEDRFSHLRVMQNPMSLGRYIGTHEYDIAEAVGLKSIRRHNQTFYSITKKEPKDAQQS